jgi:hypothetical protein
LAISVAQLSFSTGQAARSLGLSFAFSFFVLLLDLRAAL